MSNKNPFKKITPPVSLPEDLKEEIIQEVEEIIEEESDTSNLNHDTEN